MMNEEKQVMNALVNLMVCPRCPGRPSCNRCSYIGVADCHERLISDSMNVLNKHFGSTVTNEVVSEPDYEVQVVDVLRDIGIPAHVLGYRYAVRAIVLAIKHSEYLDAMTCVMYPTIAKAFNTTAPRVERAIRHAIEVAWRRGDPDTLYRYFGNTIDPYKGKPTNSEFIAYISEYLKQRNRDTFSE